MGDVDPGVWTLMKFPTMWFHTCADGSLVRTILVGDAPAACVECGKSSASCKPFDDAHPSDCVINGSPET